MVIKIIKIFAINVVFLAIAEFVFSNEIIIPKKKPQLSKEVVQKKIVKGTLVPLKKPVTKKKEKIVKKKEKKVLKISGVIIPKNKPLIVKKEKSRVVKKSKFYSKKDFQIAKQSVLLMEKRKWSEAEKTAKKASDKSIYNFIRWNHLLTTGNNVTFSGYKLFKSSLLF